MGKPTIKCERVFNYTHDDTAIKIVMLHSDTFVWMQYGPNEGSSCDIEVCKQYTKKEIQSMVSFFEPLGSIEAIELFNKFVNT
jgi:hypothetical protein